MSKLTPLEKAAMLSYQQVQDWFQQSKFIFWEDYAKVMYQSWLAGRNLVVYGRGGFGKSEMTYHFFNLLATVDPAYTSDLLDCGGADSTKIWAGIKGDQLPNFIYNVESSWLASKYVVFEELFDAQLGALVEMKQTLTSGEFRTPLQRYVSKCEWLVCLTNKSKAEVLDSVSEDSRNTVDALLQRFPLAYQLEWTKQQLQDPESWSQLLDKGYHTMHQQVVALFASAIAECHRNKKAADDFMSPRSALHLLSTSQSWATACGQQLDLCHFIDTAWAYPSMAASYFRDQEYYWVTPQPPAPPVMPEPPVPPCKPLEFVDMVANMGKNFPLQELQKIRLIAVAITDKYPIVLDESDSPDFSVVDPDDCIKIVNGITETIDPENLVFEIKIHLQQILPLKLKIWSQENGLLPASFRSVVSEEFESTRNVRIVEAV